MQGAAAVQLVESATAIADIQSGMLLTSMLLNLVMQGAMMWFVLFINSLQMIVHLPMMHVILPANVKKVFGFIIPIVMFDIVEAFFSEDIPLAFDEPA